AGAPRPIYQWLKEGMPLLGATNNNFELLNATTSDAGCYELTASNIAGVATSQVALVTVKTRAPWFHYQPEDANFFVGSQAQLSPPAGGGPPPKYQWLFEHQPIPGATGPVLEFPSVSAADQGAYSVVASNAVGMITSRLARVTVAIDP